MHYTWSVGKLSEDAFVEVRSYGREDRRSSAGTVGQRFNAKAYNEAVDYLTGRIESRAESLASRASPKWGTSVTATVSGTMADGMNGDFSLDAPRREKQISQTLSDLPTRMESWAGREVADAEGRAYRSGFRSRSGRTRGEDRSDRSRRR